LQMLTLYVTSNGRSHHCFVLFLSRELERDLVN
jgi:hypothetical protein